MRSKFKRIILIIFLTVVIPILTYVVYEVSTLNENEQLIEEMYKTQLESLIFSVNQYSNDFLSALMNKVEQDIDQYGEFTKETTNLILQDGFQVFTVLSGDEEWQITVNNTDFDLEETLVSIKRDNEELVNQLTGFLEAGYRKLEPTQMIKIKGQVYQVLMAIVKAGDEPYLCIGLIDPIFFAEEVLSPKMQQIGNEEMIVTLQMKDSPDLIFTTDTLVNNILVSKEMWLFPDMLIGVSPTSVTVSELVSTRLRNNLIAVGLLIIMLGVGLTLVIRNVNQEMQLAQSKSEFVSNVSHELRTPLALISMFAETQLLGRVKSEEKSKEYTEIIFKETNRLTNIVNRILNFSRIEAGRRTYHFGETNMDELMEEIIRDYSYHLEQSGFTYQLVKNGPVKLLHADKDAIYEAVVNLMDNSIKYSDESKELILETGKDGDKVWIKVQDKGVGIPKERLPHIFDQFYRVSENNIYTTQGTGLGLTIIKHIMDAHHGRIKVDSELGKGSTFTLIFNQNLNHGEDLDR